MSSPRIYEFTSKVVLKMVMTSLKSNSKCIYLHTHKKDPTKKVYIKLRPTPNAREYGPGDMVSLTYLLTYLLTQAHTHTHTHTFRSQ